MIEIDEQVQLKKAFYQWTTVTPVSKFLALVLFVTLPFIGAFVGYKYAPEKIVVVEVVSPLVISETTASNAAPSTNSACDFQSYSIDRQFETSIIGGVILPTFDGHLWQESSHGAASGVWQQCRDVPSYLGYNSESATMFVSIPNYVIPPECDPKEGDFGKLVCTNPAYEIIQNGRDNFFETLLSQFKSDISHKYDMEIDVPIPAALFINDNEYSVLINNPERSFIIRFSKEMYDKEFIISYIKGIEIMR